MNKNMTNSKLAFKRFNLDQLIWSSSQKDIKPEGVLKQINSNLLKSTFFLKRRNFSAWLFMFLNNLNF